MESELHTQLLVTPDHLAIVRQILQAVVPTREVWVFGSRVAGPIKKYSDLDLAIIGDQPLSLSELGTLRDEFSDSDLPYRVDVVDWATTPDYFREIIKTKYIRL